MYPTPVRLTEEERRQLFQAQRSIQPIGMGCFILQELCLTVFSSCLGAFFGLYATLLASAPPKPWENPWGNSEGMPVSTFNPELRRSWIDTGIVVGFIAGGLIYIAQRIKDSCR